MKVFAVLAPVIALILIGCGDSSSGKSSMTGGAGSGSHDTKSGGIVGKWKVDPDFRKEHENIKPEGFMTGFASTFWYDLKADKTFEGSMSSGTYKVDGNKVTITTTKLMGSTQAGVDMTGDLTNDGKTLILHPPANGLLPAELASGIKMAKE